MDNNYVSNVESFVVYRGFSFPSKEGGNIAVKCGHCFNLPSLSNMVSFCLDM